MQVLEDINVAQLPSQAISRANTSVASNTTPTQPKLSMVWKKEWREGHQSFFATWVVD